MDWGRQRVEISSDWMELIPLIYFSIVRRLLYVVTLLVVMVMSLESTLMKFTTVFELVFLSRLLILATCLLDLTNTFETVSEFMRIIIWWYKGPLVIMQIFSLLFLLFLTVLYISSIFSTKRFGKFSFKLRISLIFDPATFVYVDIFGSVRFLPALVVAFFFLMRFLTEWGGIDREIIEISIFFPLKILVLVLVELVDLTFRVNLFTTKL